MTREQAAKKIEKSAALQEGLDEIIHDLHSQLATELNNGGPLDQLKWLMENADMDVDEVLKQLKNG